MTEFSSQRLNYRTLEVEDVSETYVDWLNDPEVNRFLETRFSHQTLDSCKAYVIEMGSHPSHHLFGVYLGENGKHIGNVKLGFINPHHLRAQLSLMIGDKESWGRGYATEIISKITAWGFEELQLQKIEAGCYDENLGSLRAFLKSGYQVEGFFRQSAIVEDRRIGSFWLGILAGELVS